MADTEFDGSDAKITGTLGDPPDAAGYERWGLEGALPDDSVVRITVWSPGERGTPFGIAVKAALYEAMKSLYPHCPRNAGGPMASERPNVPTGPTIPRSTPQTPGTTPGTTTPTPPTPPTSAPTVPPAHPR